MSTPSRESLKYGSIVITDTIPFETPILFSNLKFFEFIVNNEVCVTIVNSGYKLQWRFTSDLINNQVFKIFGIPIDRQIENFTINVRGININHCRVHLKRTDLSKSPYQYSIFRDSSKQRVLSLPHPLNQIDMVRFYKDYEEIVLHFCKESIVSLRKPIKVRKQPKNNSKKKFSTKRYAEQIQFNHLVLDPTDQLHSFFESPMFQRMEKEFSYLMMLDISTCFDSMYTHSMAWAIHGLKHTKRNYYDGFGRSSSFASMYDETMARMNYGETNGILVGPEFSRVFAEIILQVIDADIIDNLSSKSTSLVHNLDYRMFRYVDDYFVFIRSSNEIPKVEKAVNDCLRPYKMQLKPMQESKILKRPIITSSSIAKNRVVNLIEKNISTDMLGKLGNLTTEELTTFTFNVLKFVRNDLRIEFKAIMKENEVEYSRAIPLVCAMLRGSIKQISREMYSRADDNDVDLVSELYIASVAFHYYCYSVGGKFNFVNQIINCVWTYLLALRRRGERKSEYNRLRSIVSKFNIDALKDALISEERLFETMQLLILQKELGREYRLNSAFLTTYTEALRDNNPGSKRLDYFQIIIMLHYISNVKRYDVLKQSIIDDMQSYFLNDEVVKDRESTVAHLYADMMLCPHLTDQVKLKITEQYGSRTGMDDQLVIGGWNWGFFEWNGLSKAFRKSKKRKFRLLYDTL